MLKNISPCGQSFDSGRLICLLCLEYYKCEEKYDK